jgi:hypothetical protein
MVRGWGVGECGPMICWGAVRLLANSYSYIIHWCCFEKGRNFKKILYWEHNGVRQNWMKKVSVQKYSSCRHSTEKQADVWFPVSCYDKTCPAATPLHFPSITDDVLNIFQPKLFLKLYFSLSPILRFLLSFFITSFLFHYLIIIINFKVGHHGLFRFRILTSEMYESILGIW